MSVVLESALASGLKATLNKVIDDPEYGESKTVHKQWLDVLSMEDAWEDDQEVAGTGLLRETAESQEIQTGNIREGYLERYIAKKFAQKLIFSDEIVEDNKYPKMLRGAQRLVRAAWKTVDIETTLMLARGFSTDYVYGTGKPLFSATQPLAWGGSFSNLMGSPVSPSEAAIITATTQIMKYPGHDGIAEPGIMPEKVICPVDQWATWKKLLKAEFNPVANNFADPNVVRDMGLTLVKNVYWSNTTTNWAIRTNAENGPNIRWKRKFRTRTWMENSQEVVCHSISGRWARGTSEPRAMYGVNA
jgi:hypothetical protein